MRAAQVAARYKPYSWADLKNDKERLKEIQTSQRTMSDRQRLWRMNSGSRSILKWQGPSGRLLENAIVLPIAVPAGFAEARDY